MKKHKYTKKVINSSNYVNLETGELLSDESPNITSVNRIDGDKMLVSYDRYVTIDYDALQYLTDNMGKTDNIHLTSMIGMLKDSSNMLFQRNGELHDSDTLAKQFNYAKSAFYKFVSTQMKAGILYELKGNFNGLVGKRYILNPFLARVRKQIDIKSLNYFAKFNKFY